MLLILPSTPKALSTTPVRLATITSFGCSSGVHTMTSLLNEHQWPHVSLHTPVTSLKITKKMLSLPIHNLIHHIHPLMHTLPLGRIITVSIIILYRFRSTMHAPLRRQQPPMLSPLLCLCLLHHHITTRHAHYFMPPSFIHTSIHQTRWIDLS